MSPSRPFNKNRFEVLRDQVLRHPLALAFAATLLFRFYGLYIVKILNNDTIFYLELTRRLSDGGLLQGIREIAVLAYTPLYPLMIHALDFLFQDTVRAAVAVSFIFGTLCVIPFFVTARRIFDERKALIASLLFAADSYFVRYSIYVIRDMVALFFLLTSAAFLVSPKRGRSLRGSLFCLSAFLAVFIRPEYLLIYVLSGAVYLLVQSRWRALLLLGLSIFLFLLVTTPLKTHPGAAILHLVLLERVAAGLSEFRNHLFGIAFLDTLWSFATVALKSLSDFLGFLTPLAALVSVLGALHAAARWRLNPELSRLLLITIACSILIYAGWGAVGGYFTRRFLIVPGSLLLMFAPSGLDVIRGLAHRRPERTASIALFLVFSTMVLYTVFHEVGGRREGLKHAGLHIFRTWQGEKRPSICSDEQILSFYAGGIHVPYTERGAGESLEEFLRARGVDFIIMKEFLGEGPDEEVRNLLERGTLTLDATLPYGGRDGKERQIGVYRIPKRPP